MDHDVGSLLDACLAARPEIPEEPERLEVGAVTSETYLFCCHCSKRTLEGQTCRYCGRDTSISGVVLLTGL